MNENSNLVPFVAHFSLAPYETPLVPPEARLRVDPLP